MRFQQVLKFKTVKYSLAAWFQLSGFNNKNNNKLFYFRQQGHNYNYTVSNNVFQSVFSFISFHQFSLFIDICMGEH